MQNRCALLIKRKKLQEKVKLVAYMFYKKSLAPSFLFPGQNTVFPRLLQELRFKNLIKDGFKMFKVVKLITTHFKCYSQAGTNIFTLFVSFKLLKFESLKRNKSSIID